MIIAISCEDERYTNLIIDAIQKSAFDNLYPEAEEPEEFEDEKHLEDWKDSIRLMSKWKVVKLEDYSYASIQEDFNYIIPNIASIEDFNKVKDAGKTIRINKIYINYYNKYDDLYERHLTEQNNVNLIRVTNPKHVKYLDSYKDKNQIALEECKEFDYIINSNGTINQLDDFIKNILQLEGIIQGGELKQS